MSMTFEKLKALLKEGKTPKVAEFYDEKAKLNTIKNDVIDRIIQ